MRVGLIINPIAGMGGSVGLKGTDGAEMLRRAQQLGARPVASARALRALRIVRGAEIRFLSPAGEMGGDVLEAAGHPYEALDLDVPPSGASTKAAAKAMLKAGVELLVFAGGDGTARDIMAAIGREIPVIGIPAGVKMQSAAFALTPEAAGRLMADWSVLPDSRRAVAEAEIMDIDEDLLRQGRLNSSLYGYLSVPCVRGLVQSAKSSGFASDDEQLISLGREIAKEMKPRTTYFVGPGTTAKRTMDALGLCGTLLGIDAVKDGVIVGSDLNARQVIALADQGPVAIILGVTGGQGFVVGRGNQQIGPDLLARVWPEGLVMVAGSSKLQRLDRPQLVLDTGDAALDARMRGYARVRTGPKQSMMMQLV